MTHDAYYAKLAAAVMPNPVSPAFLRQLLGHAYPQPDVLAGCPSMATIREIAKAFAPSPIGMTMMRGPFGALSAREFLAVVGAARPPHLSLVPA